jgi:hypothetical protein
MVIIHWIYFFKAVSAGVEMSAAGGIFSTLTYLAAGTIAACLFYGFSQIIKLLIAINAKIK